MFSETFEFLYTEHDMLTEKKWTQRKAQADYDTEQNLTPTGASKYFRGKGEPMGKYSTTGDLMPVTLLNLLVFLMI